MRNGWLAATAALMIAASAGRPHAQTAADRSAEERLSADQIAIACAPSPAAAPPALNALRVRGGQDTVARELFGTGDLVIVDGGTQAGVTLGQRYYLRRAVTFGARYTRAEQRPGIIDTTGWLRIVAVNTSTAVAIVDYACDGVLAADYLEPFTPPAVVDASANPVGEPDFSSLGRVRSGTMEQRLAGAGNLVLVDRGGDQDFEAGSRLAIYRDLRMPGLPLVSIGEGIVVSKGDGRSLMRILSSRTAVESGDYVATRR